MVKIRNKKTGEIVQANGVWSSFCGIAVPAGQSHSIVGGDSPIKWDLETSEFGVYDETSEEYWDFYQIPLEWEIVE